MNQLKNSDEINAVNANKNSYGDIMSNATKALPKIRETEQQSNMNMPAVYTGDNSGYYNRNYNNRPMYYGTNRDIKACNNIISIAGIKGGVGKTTVAKELATALSMASIDGRRLNVCLIDCDIEFGDVSSVIRISESRDIAGFLSDAENVLNSYGEVYGYGMINQYYNIKDYMSTYESGLRVIPAPRLQGHNNFASYDVMTALIDKVRRAGFDFIVLDTAGNNYEYTIAAQQMASQLLLVTTLEYSAINSMNQMLQYYAQMGIPMEKMQLIINKAYGNRRKDGISSEEVVAFLRFFGEATVLPFISDMAFSNNLGKPEVMNRTSKYSRAISDLVRKVLERRIED